MSGSLHLGAKLATAFFAITLAACSPSADNAQTPVPLVDVVKVEILPHATRQTLTGTVEARAQTPAAFLISGRVESLNVSVGDRVSKGQLLASMSKTEQLAEVAAAQAGVTVARSRLGQAKASLDRQSSLWEQGLTTRSAFDSANTAWETAASAAESADAQLKLAEEALRYTSLAASADGVIIRRMVEADEIVQAGSPIYLIAEDGPLNVVVNVQETAVAGLGSDQSISVSLVSAPDAKVTGKIAEVAPALDATGTVPVKVAIDAKLPLGAAVTVEFAQAPAERVILPAQALGQSHSSPIVWLVSEDMTVQQTAVKVDSYETGKVIIEQGLKTGDVVVVAGSQFLTPGQRIEIQRGETE